MPEGFSPGTLFLYGTAAAMPPAGVNNRYYWTTDTHVLYRDNGAAWEVVSGAIFEYGTLAARPAFGTVNRYYWATDVRILFRDTGAAWEVVSALWACAINILDSEGNGLQATAANLQVAINNLT